MTAATRNIVDEIGAELLRAGQRRVAIRRRRITIAAACLALLPFAAAGTAQVITGDPLAGLDLPPFVAPDHDASHRVDLSATLPDGTPWVGAAYLGSSGTTLCLTAPAQDQAPWRGVGCRSGMNLAFNFHDEPPSVETAVDVVHGADGTRTAVVYGVVDAGSRVSSVSVDDTTSSEIHLSDRQLTLPVVIPPDGPTGGLTAQGRAEAASFPKQFVLQPFVATVPLAAGDTTADDAVEVHASVVGPDGQTRVR
ncbi:hypothetical protein [Conexibacter woesei]|uniref:hypothetical protein n=1 Tax=Conexibacter woesei TaxID=191495 RepID=UPI000427923A|nr:hypothetical protein [Conexibacter woesei]